METSREYYHLLIRSLNETKKDVLRWIKKPNIELLISTHKSIIQEFIDNAHEEASNMNEKRKNNCNK